MDWKKVSNLYKTKRGVGCDGFHPKVPLDVKRKREEKSMAATSLYDDVLLDSEECHE